MTSLIGQSLGRYHILEQLGEGGMATVYKAYDTRLERDVAVKIIRRGSFPPDALDRILKRFEREAKALARLSHPNIVKIHDYGEYEGTPYLVMEYLPGGTLKQRLGQPTPWLEALKLLIPISQALQYAHSEGMIHRDVKPANILITRSGNPMLSDFGIAKILEGGDSQTLTGTGVGVGTPEYMAPEQWTGEAGHKADIYALGVVLYELVTGRKPYSADTPAAVLLKQANEPLPHPRGFVDTIPEGIEKILIKALAKQPGDRYENMAGLTDAMEALLVEPGKQEISPPSWSSTAIAPPALPVSSWKDEQRTVDQGLVKDTASTIDQEVSNERHISTTQLRQKQEVVTDSFLNAQPPPRKKKNKLPWIIGLGGLLAIVICVVAGLLIFTWLSSLNDQIEIAPTKIIIGGNVLWTQNCDPRSDPDFCRISDSLVIFKEFYSVIDTLQATLTYDLPSTAGDLSVYDVVVVDFCLSGSLDGTRDAIKQYILSGGSALVMGGNFCITSEGMTADSATRLTRDFGMVFTGDDDATNLWADSISDHPVTAGISDIFMFRHAYLEISSPAQALIRLNGLPILGVYDGTGTILAISDEGFHWGRDTRAEISSSDNFKLWENMLSWLIAQSRAKR